MRKPSPAMIVALLSLFIALGGAGMAATGGNLILGNANSATSATSLSAPVGGSALQVSNSNTSAGATALGLHAASGHPAFTVNTVAKIPFLNADKLDGIDSSGFLPSTGTTTVSYNGQDFVSENSSLTLQQNGVGTEINVKSSATGVKYVEVPVDLPLSVFGTALKIKSADICFFSGGSSAITLTQLRRDGRGGLTFFYSDTTTRTGGPTCYTVAPATPVAATEGFEILLGLNFASTSDVFQFLPGSVTLTT